MHVCTITYIHHKNPIQCAFSFCVCGVCVCGNSDFLLSFVFKSVNCNAALRSMKKLLGLVDCVSWLFLLTGAAQLPLVCGEGMLTIIASLY